MRLIAFVSRCVKPPYSLHAGILLGATAVVFAIGAVYSALIYQRLADDMLVSVEKWSRAVAQLVATTNTSAVLTGKIATVDSNLQQAISLSGVAGIAVFMTDGRPMSQAVQSDEALSALVRENDTVHVPSSLLAAEDGELTSESYFAWAPVTGPEGRTVAWVRVQGGLAERKAELNMLWLQSTSVVAVLLALFLIGFHLIVRRALTPIRKLSQFASTLPDAMGTSISVGSVFTCTEAQQLAIALNYASRRISEQVARLQAIVNTAAEAIVTLDEQGRLASANPAAVQMFGWSEQDMLGRDLETFIPGMSPGTLRLQFEPGRARATVKRVVRVDFHGKRSDGSRLPVEVSLGQVDGHESLRYTCIVRNMTQERAAQESAELYARALACSHNGVFIVHARQQHHPIVYVNEAFSHLTGLQPNQVLGQSLKTFSERQNPDPGVVALALAIQQNVHTKVIVQGHPRRDSSPVIAEVTLSPVWGTDRQVTHFVGIASDVTARLAVEAEMALRSARLDAIFSLSPDGFVLFDMDGQLVFVNPAFERISGVKWAEIESGFGMVDFDLMMSSLFDDEHPFPGLSACRADADSWGGRLELVRPQKRVLIGQAKRNAAGQGETIVYFRDVTHEDEVDRMKSEFLTTAAHELRTPMVSILGFTELLLKRKYSDERRADMLETIHRQSTRLVGMVNELLDLARIESRQGKDLNPASQRLGDVLEQAVAPFLTQSNADRLRVSVTHAETLLFVDAAKIQQVFANVLSNAFKYSPNGGDVVITTLEGTMDGTLDGRPAVAVRVRDHGIGMTPEQLERVSERFYRADPSGNIPGTGLGMSLVKELLEMQGGRHELASKLGVGTVVTVWFPVDTPTLVEAEFAVM